MHPSRHMIRVAGICLLACRSYLVMQVSGYTVQAAAVCKVDTEVLGSQCSRSAHTA